MTDAERRVDGDTLFVPHGSRCEADDGRGPDFGRCEEVARAWVTTKNGDKLVCDFHRRHWHGDPP